VFLYTIWIMPPEVRYFWCLLSLKCCSVI